MASLDDSFNNDLAELENDFGDDEELQQQEMMENNEDEDQFGFTAKEDISALQANAKSSVYANMKHLLQDSTYVDFIKRIEEISKETNPTNISNAQYQQYIYQSNQYILDVNAEISLLKDRITDTYKKRLPDLAVELPNTMDYIRAVERIGNHTDIMGLKFDDFLPHKVEEEFLSEAELNSVMQDCHDAIELDHHREVLLSFIGQKMSTIAPNVCAMIGSHVAALILGQVGGLKELSAMPSCDITNIGHLKTSRNAIGTSERQGYLFQTEIIQNIPEDYQSKACKILANKLILAARIDLGGAKDDHMGKQYCDYVNNQVKEWQKPTESGTVKAIKPPVNLPKKRRGGRKLRRIRQLYQQNELDHLRNRMSMGKPVGDYGDDAFEGDDLGLLQQEDASKIRVQPKRKVRSMAAKKRLQQVQSSVVSSGFTTSLIANPGFGIELVTKTNKEQTVNDKYFSASSGFTSVRPN